MNRIGSLSLIAVITEFVAALLRSPLPDTEDYRVLTEPFWHLHKEAVRQAMQASE